ncbi:PREDICTED: cyclic GMP-AMP synthase-like, partial [Branchiostoma belcheri]|uniref:Cyclic GMP-AMP synthase-like n=1 Tax=Branchiostoma belcheri TaxID=7741 RepID=A0A6P4Y898_BRABE
PATRVGRKSARPQKSAPPTTTSKPNKQTIHEPSPTTRKGRCSPSAAHAATINDTGLRPGTSPDVPATRAGRKSARPQKSAPPTTTSKPNKQTIRRQSTRETSFKTKLKKAIANLVRVPSDDKSETAKIYNPIVNCILEEIKKMAVDEGEDDIFRLRQLNSGSYFENLKVDTTNEFDFMFCIYGQKLTLEETEPSLGMVAVKLPRKNKSSLRNYLTPDGYLSPKKLLNRFRGLVEQTIETLSAAGADSPFKDLEFKLMRQKDGCPAVTLNVAKKRLQMSIDLVFALEVPTPWPKCTKGWNQSVTHWPDSRDIRAIKRNELHLVAKAAPHDKDPDGEKLWRLSFSQAEKEIFNGRGQILSPTDASNHATLCRKDCLRCLKYIKYKLQLTGGVSRDVDFASYHLKTVLLHAIVKRPDGWENENLVTCLVCVIDVLVSSIETRHLPHFFIPGYNLFEPAIFKGLEHLDTVKDQFLRVKEDLVNERLPKELDALEMPVH